jgi:outer membrane protein TolC
MNQGTQRGAVSGQKLPIAALGALAACVACGAASAQSVSFDPLRYSVATPRPINPAENTTNPSAQATQSLNPYLGSVPSKATGTTIQLSLQGAIERGLRYNLGIVESSQGAADVHGDRLRALATLLPQLQARGRQDFDDISYKEFGLKLPPIPGLAGLPATTGGFGYQDARVNLTQSLYNAPLRAQYRAQKSAEEASILNIKDSRDVVVLAVGAAYLQVIANAARVETIKAELASARELDQQTANRVKSEVSPEIDSLHAQVALQSAQQRLTNAANQLEKDKLTLARITGLAIDQNFTVTDTLAYHPLTGVTDETTTAEALRSRADLASAEASVRAAESTLRAQKAERLPVISVSADYGAAGANLGNMSQVYSVSGNVSVPLYTGGRIRADIEQAQADLARKRAEYEDLKGRIAYDVRVAWLDIDASESSVKVAERNKALAERVSTQSLDRYANGVTNYLEVVQAQEAVSAAADNYIDSLYSFNVAAISLARAMGGAESRIQQFLGAK